MRNRTRPRLTYANVTATIALFLALGGGAWAATTLPRNSVGPAQLKKGAVTPAKISAAALARLKGTTGERGPQGPAGGAGPKGETGARGEAGPRGETGPTGGRGETGPRGPSDAYSRFDGENTTGSKSVTVAVPAGSYAVSASMVAKFTGTGYTEVNCLLNGSTGSTGVGGSEVSLPAPPGTASVYLAQPSADAGITIPAGGGTITWSCGRVGGAVTGLTFAVGSLVATRVETLSAS